MTSATLLLFAALAACSWPTDERAELPAGSLVIDPQAPLDTTLGVSADTYVRQGHPNQNSGTDTLLRVRSNGHNRAMLQVDPAALAAATGGGTLLAARLELTITANADNWGPDGREIALHRLTTPWTELGATWNCAVDSVPGNQQAECAGATAWEMSAGGPNPWVATPTAMLTMTNELSGVVTFDVTADVAAWLGGTPNAGWILKKVNEGATGRVEFGSRESAHGAQLVLTVSADTGRPPIPDGFIPPANPLLVSPPGQDSVLVLRNFVEIVFDDTTSGSTIVNLFARYGAQVAGGDTVLESYIVQVPDPGGTYEGLDSLLSRLRSEPGVRYALRYVFSEPIRDPGRYPDDDSQQMTRADWLGPTTDGTRALRAIRAPLAWGCETGRYGSAPVPVGVIDDIVETTLQDLNPSFNQNNLYPASATQALDTSHTLPPGTLSHGTGVAGVISARGDNGVGVAGLTWQTDLYVFRLAREDNGGVTWRLRRRSGAIARAIRLATRTHVRILHSSVEASADPEEARRLADAIADFVNTPPGRIFVQGGQNYRVTIRPDTAAKLRGGFVMQQAMIDLDPVARARAFLVGAANRDGSDIWNRAADSGATLVTGVTDLLAPAEEILTLVRPQDFGVSVRTGFGTSFAAPMVTGTAALLWAFAPTLTADGVKSYILKGAEKRIDATGALQDVLPIPNSDGLHLLDAYGALALVARDSGGTPVCGFPVFARDDAVYQVRTPGDTQIVPVPVPAGSFLTNVSVAQGGRLLAVSNSSGGDEVVQFSYTGQLDTTLPGLYRRQFLERDTLDLTDPDATGDSWIVIRRGDGTADSLHAAALTFPTPTGSRFTVEVEGSPAGDWLAVRTADAAGGTVTHRWDLLDFVQQVPLNVATIVRTISQPLTCTDCEGYFVPDRIAGWSHDGQHVLFAFPLADRLSGALVALRTRAQTITVSNGAPDIAGQQIKTVQGVIARRPRFTADDAVLIWNELDLSSTCYRATRMPNDPTQLVGVDVADIGECDLGDGGPTIFNVPPPIITARDAMGAPRIRGTQRPRR